ncbi:MAG: response regulator [Steroidobacteraceae bacterium]
MNEPGLRGRRVFVVEDDCVTAMDLSETLTEAGAQIVGPATTVEAALELLRNRPDVDIALLDVRLENESVFPLADELVRRDVPIVFTTGYESHEIPERFQAARYCEKPVGLGVIARTLSDELTRWVNRRRPRPTDS